MSVPTYLAEKRDRYGVTAMFKTDTGAAMFVRESENFMKEGSLDVPAGQTGGKVVVQVPDTWSKLPPAEQSAEADRVWKRIQELQAAIEIYGGTHALLI